LHPFFVWRFCSCSGLLIQIPLLFCVKKHIEDFLPAQIVKIVKFVIFTGTFTSKHLVKSVEETCETVHSTPIETCQHEVQFDRPCKSACFWWVKETPKDAQGCDPGLCKFVGYFHVFPSSYLRRRKGPAVPKRDQQKMHQKSLYIFGARVQLLTLASGVDNTNFTLDISVAVASEEPSRSLLSPGQVFPHTCSCCS